jgi:hypothetical protein
LSIWKWRSSGRSLGIFAWAITPTAWKCLIRVWGGHLRLFLRLVVWFLPHVFGNLMLTLAYCRLCGENLFPMGICSTSRNTSRQLLTISRCGCCGSCWLSCIWWHGVALDCASDPALMGLLTGSVVLAPCRLGVGFALVLTVWVIGMISWGSLWEELRLDGCDVSQPATLGWENMEQTGLQFR